MNIILLYFILHDFDIYIYICTQQEYVGELLKGEKNNSSSLTCSWGVKNTSMYYNRKGWMDEKKFFIMLELVSDV